MALFTSSFSSTRMNQIHTHYDNLKVTRNAPPEVIRAAYKTLSQKFHPDRNPGNADAARIMAIINTSYAVLSDPDKRQEHDLWVAQQERVSEQTTKPSNPQPPGQASTQPHPHPKASADGVISHVLRNWRLYGIAAFFVWIWTTNKPSTPAPSEQFSASDFVEVDKPSTPPPKPKPYQANPAPVSPEYVRPSTAPNGQPWPVSASYVGGYTRLHEDGLSTVTVDNSQNDSDVFVKLVSLDSAKAYPVRQFYIPAFGSFSLNKITAGSYDIRYRDLGNGGLSRSEAFNLQEIQRYDGIQYSKITMTLYKVRNGNMQTYGLSEAEF
jgi:curved DNA-binding protein CbpA